MSDEKRRALARAAGDGDIDAARKLVKLLERENAVRDLTPETLVWSLTDEDFGALKKWGRRVRVLNVIRRAFWIKACDEAREPESRRQAFLWWEERQERLTLRELSQLTSDQFKRARDCGPTLLDAVARVLQRAGLTLADEYSIDENASPNPAIESLPNGLTCSSLNPNDKDTRSP